MPCLYCGGFAGSHSPSCPEYTPVVFTQCAECGGDIEVGDTCFHVGNRCYCEYCCCEVEAEFDDYDDSDRKYDEWRDRQLDEEWEHDKCISD